MSGTCCAQARADERAAVLDHLAEKSAEVGGLRDKGRVPAHEAEQLISRLDAIADGIRTGLHR